MALNATQQSKRNKKWNIINEVVINLLCIIMCIDNSSGELESELIFFRRVTYECSSISLSLQFFFDNFVVTKPTRDRMTTR